MGASRPDEANGGFTAAGGLATFRYDFSKDTNATFYGGLQRLTGSVGASPIPNEIGSRNQFTAGLSIARSFEIPDSPGEYPPACAALLDSRYDECKSHPPWPIDYARSSSGDLRWGFIR